MSPPSRPGRSLRISSLGGSTVRPRFAPDPDGAVPAPDRHRQPGASAPSPGPPGRTRPIDPARRWPRSRRPCPRRSWPRSRNRGIDAAVAGLDAWCGMPGARRTTGRSSSGSRGSRCDGPGGSMRRPATLARRLRISPARPGRASSGASWRRRAGAEAARRGRAARPRRGRGAAEPRPQGPARRRRRGVRRAACSSPATRWSSPIPRRAYTLLATGARTGHAATRRGPASSSRWPGEPGGRQPRPRGRRPADVPGRPSPGGRPRPGAVPARRGPAGPARAPRPPDRAGRRWSAISRGAKSDAAARDLRARSPVPDRSILPRELKADDHGRANRAGLGIAALRRFLAADPGHAMAVEAAYQVADAERQVGRSEAGPRRLPRRSSTATAIAPRRPEARRRQAELAAIGHVPGRPHPPAAGQAGRGRRGLDATISTASPTAPSSPTPSADPRHRARHRRRARPPTAGSKRPARREAFVARNPLDPRVPLALFRNGRSFLAEGQADRAVAAWENLIARFPADVQAARAHWEIARIFEEKKADPGRAIERLRRSARSPGSRRPASGSRSWRRSRWSS